jgi:hypothetical protein
MTWFNTKSWDPTLLVDKRNLTEAREPVPVEERLTSIQEPEPGTLEWLYQDHGGES